MSIDNDINVCHKFVRDKYAKRFPELESLVPNALDYLMTVKELGNNLDNVKNNENLQQFLTQATIMVVRVTASTTQGTNLSEDELNYILDACNVAIEINQCKLKIYQFVESRMSFIAPNITGKLTFIFIIFLCFQSCIVFVYSHYRSFYCRQANGSGGWTDKLIENALM